MRRSPSARNVPRCFGLVPIADRTSVIFNVARATIAGLKALKRPDEVARLRGLSAEEFVPKGLLNAYRESQRGPVEYTEVK